MTNHNQNNGNSINNNIHRSDTKNLENNATDLLKYEFKKQEEPQYIFDSKVNYSKKIINDKDNEHLNGFNKEKTYNDKHPLICFIDDIKCPASKSLIRKNINLKIRISYRHHTCEN